MDLEHAVPHLVEQLRRELCEARGDEEHHDAVVGNLLALLEQRLHLAVLPGHRRDGEELGDALVRALVLLAHAVDLLVVRPQRKLGHAADVARHGGGEEETLCWFVLCVCVCVCVRERVCVCV